MICLIVSFLPSKCRPEISLTQVPGEGPRTERPALTWQPTATHGKRNRETAQLRAKFSQKSPKSVGIIQDKPTMDRRVYFAKSCCCSLEFRNVNESRFTVVHHLINSKHKQKLVCKDFAEKNIVVGSLLFRITFHGFFRKLFAWGVFSARPWLADHHRG